MTDKVYIVVHEDRHRDPWMWVYRDGDLAVQRANHEHKAASPVSEPNWPRRTWFPWSYKHGDGFSIWTREKDIEEGIDND